MKNVTIRIAGSLYEKLKSDLNRPHRHAYERVGFALSRMKFLNDESVLIVIYDYNPVADEDYVRDRSVGARINSSSIRIAMKQSYFSNSGCFHVHSHYGTGIPGFSSVDLAELPKIAKDFRNVAPENAHGLLLLNENSVSAHVWLPGEEEPVTNCRISVIDFPIGIHHFLARRLRIYSLMFVLALLALEEEDRT